MVAVAKRVEIMRQSGKVTMEKGGSKRPRGRLQPHQEVLGIILVKF